MGVLLVSSSLVEPPPAFLPQPSPSNSTASSRTSSRTSWGCPQASYGSATRERAPFYAAPGHGDCCVAGCWHCDTGVTGPPLRGPARRPSAQHPSQEGLWAAGPEAVPGPRRLRGLSLPLLAMPWAQLLGVPLNTSGHSDYVVKAVCPICIHLVVGMPEVKARLLVPSA